MALFSKKIVIPRAPKHFKADAAAQNTASLSRIGQQQPDSGKLLQELRKKIAGIPRFRRRKAIVPIFVSAAWFLFALSVGLRRSRPHPLALAKRGL